MKQGFGFHHTKCLNEEFISFSTENVLHLVIDDTKTSCAKT